MKYLFCLPMCIVRCRYLLLPFFLGITTLLLSGMVFAQQNPQYDPVYKPLFQKNTSSPLFQSNRTTTQSNRPQQKISPADSPGYYVVQPGDTFYSIAQKFLTDMSQWERIWELPAGMSLTENIALTPGNTVMLFKTPNNMMRLKLLSYKKQQFGGGNNVVLPKTTNITTLPTNVTAHKKISASRPQARRHGPYYGVKTGGNRIKLSPVAWSTSIKDKPVLPSDMIDPFKVFAKVVPYADIKGAPIIAGFVDNRLLGYPGKEIFIRGKIDENIQEWYVYRPAEQLIDPETFKSLGYVSRLQGIVRPIKRAEGIYAFKVIGGYMEFERGARLIPVEKGVPYQDYSYQKPDSDISARVVGVYSGNNITTQFGTVIINRGEEDGVKRGDLFTLMSYKPLSYQNETPINDIPISGYGRIFVYRVESHTAFAQILESEGEVVLYDYVRPISGDTIENGDDLLANNNTLTNENSAAEQKADHIVSSSPRQNKLRPTSVSTNQHSPSTQRSTYRQ